VAPTIAIVGSIAKARERELGLQHLDQATDACAALGRTLAEKGCDIVVYGNDPQFIEGEVVRGYVASGKATRKSIQVFVHKQENAEFPGYDDKLFDVTVDPSDAWEVSFYRSLFQVDGVLLIGGGQSTLITGLVTLSRRTPIVAVATFGGQTYVVWRTIGAQRNYVSDANYKVMGRPWTSDSAGELIDALLDQQAAKRKQALEAEKSSAAAKRRRSLSLAVAAAAILLAVAAVIVVFQTKPGSTVSLVCLFLGPLVAGVAGAIIRNVLDDGTEWTKTMLLGLGAGAVAMLLFVAGQLATSPDALKEKGVTTLAVLAIAAGLIAGVTFDAVFKKVISQDVVNVGALEKVET
jgi:hypothetical protein